ncbi:MAG: DUF2252 family protein [Gemmataceae bacterium]
MDIQSATQSYESWLARFCALNQDDLAYKHEQLANPASAFPFFRGTYYRWLQHWPVVCPHLQDTPRILAVGDLHVENFGSWRDSDGRLVWGVNDFDEAAEAPYVNDLVRLTASVRFARQAGVFDLKIPRAAAAVLKGYRDNLAAGGLPFVLEERHPELRAMAMAVERDPVRFWKKMTRLLANPEASPPEDVCAALRDDMLIPGVTCAFRFRPKVGMGSLGKPRFVALADCQGGWVAREAKVVTPPASTWVRYAEKNENLDKPGSRMAECVANAVRCPDPFYRPGPRWIIRRLAPRCSRIELTQLGSVKDQLLLLESMGAEIANIHLGTPHAARTILADLDHRPAGWLETAARDMAKALEADWTEWKGTTGKNARP